MDNQLFQEGTIPAECTPQVSFPTIPGNQSSYSTTSGNQSSYPTTPGNQSSYPTTPGNQSSYPTTPGNQQFFPGPFDLSSPTSTFPDQHCNPTYTYLTPSNQVPYLGTPVPHKYQAYSPGVDTLINANGSPNTSFINGEQKGYYEITLNCKNDVDDNRKSRPFRCIKKDQRVTMVMMTPSKKNGDKINNEDKVFSVWTKHELPKGSQFRWLVLRKCEKEAHKPVYMCPTHGEDGWGEWVRKIVPSFFPMLTKQENKSVEPFIIPGQYGHYELKEEHYMLVVPVTSLRMSKGTNVHTGEEGFIYSGSFYFPCNTKDLKSKENCVTLVVSLEGPSIEPEVLTFDLRVCACPGRDGDKMVDNGKKPKKSKKRGATRKDSSASKQPKVTSSNNTTTGGGFYEEMVAKSSPMGPQSSFIDSLFQVSALDTTTDDTVTTMRCSTRTGSSKQRKILHKIREMRKQLDELERMVLESDESDSDGEEELLEE